MVKLRRVSKAWKSNIFVYEATDENETSLLQELFLERKIGIGGYGWADGRFFNTVIVRWIIA